MQKQIYEYFLRWRQDTTRHKEFLHTNLKQRVVTKYLQHLRRAFKNWIAYKGHVMISIQCGEMIFQEQESKEITNEIISTKR
jgi:hypothetical protein